MYLSSFHVIKRVKHYMTRFANIGHVAKSNASSMVRDLSPTVRNVIFNGGLKQCFLRLFCRLVSGLVSRWSTTPWGSPMRFSSVSVTSQASDYTFETRVMLFDRAHLTVPNVNDAPNSLIRTLVPQKILTNNWLKLYLFIKKWRSRVTQNSIAYLVIENIVRVNIIWIIKIYLNFGIWK